MAEIAERQNGTYVERARAAVEHQGQLRRAIRLILATLMFGVVSCSSVVARKSTLVEPTFVPRPSEPIAIMPFETESALSNLGSQVSDEIIVNLLEHAPQLKIVPADAVRTYLSGARIGALGLPDAHAIHDVKNALRCRYLMTGNLYASIGEIRYTESYSDRIATGSVTVRIVDCDSLNVVWAKHVESNYSTSLWYSNATQLPTTYLTDGQLLSGLIRKLGQEIAANFYQRD